MSSAYHNRAGRPPQYYDSRTMPNRNFYKRHRTPHMEHPRRRGNQPPRRPHYPADARYPPRYDAYITHMDPLQRRNAERQQLENYRLQQRRNRLQTPMTYQRASPAPQQRQLPPLHRLEPYMGTWSEADLLRQAQTPSIYSFLDPHYMDELNRFEAGYAPGELHREDLQWIENNWKFCRPQTDVTAGTGFMADLLNQSPPTTLADEFPFNPFAEELAQFPDMQAIVDFNQNIEHQADEQTGVTEEGSVDVESVIKDAGGRGSVSLICEGLSDVLRDGEIDWKAELNALQ